MCAFGRTRGDRDGDGVRGGPSIEGISVVGREVSKWSIQVMAARTGGEGRAGEQVRTMYTHTASISTRYDEKLPNVLMYLRTTV